MTNCPHPMCMHMRLLILKSKQSSLVYTPLSLGSFALNTISSGRTLDHRSVLLCLLTSSLTNQRMYYLYSFIIKRDKELTIFILLSRQGVNTQNKLPTNQHIDCLVYFFIIKWGKKSWPSLYSSLVREFLFRDFTINGISSGTQQLPRSISCQEIPNRSEIAFASALHLKLHPHALCGCLGLIN